MYVCIKARIASYPEVSKWNKEKLPDIEHLGQSS